MANNGVNMVDAIDPLATHRFLLGSRGLIWVYEFYLNPGRGPRLKSVDSTPLCQLHKGAVLKFSGAIDFPTGGTRSTSCLAIFRLLSPSLQSCSFPPP